MVDLNVGELLCPEVGGGVFIPLQEICPLHRKLAPDISGPSTGYIRPSTGYIRSSDRKFRCGADISAQSSGAPERSICELLASGLSENLVHRIYPAPRPEVPVGADISAQSSGAGSLSLEVVTQGFSPLLSILATYFLGSSFLQIGVVGGKEEERRQIEGTSGSGLRVERQLQ